MNHTPLYLNFADGCKCGKGTLNLSHSPPKNNQKPTIITIITWKLISPPTFSAHPILSKLLSYLHECFDYFFFSVFSGIQSCLFSTEDVEKKFRGKIKSNRSLPNIPTHYCVDTERAESAAMNLNKGGGHVPTFVSHVSRAEDEEDGFHDAETQPRLLEGEYEVVRVSHVCLYTANSSG